MAYIMWVTLLSKSYEMRDNLQYCLLFRESFSESSFCAWCAQNYLLLERFSFECRKARTKVITLTNYNKRKQRNEPIRIRSKYM